ncbi:MAG: MarR family transcriptional regulator [Kutzneria sp.]|nr:MarR family transcriptional regulator [Kutzneria sp.]
MVRQEPPAQDDPAALLGELIRLSTPVGQALAAELELSLNDLAALHHLVGRPPLGPAELGKRLGMSSASATVLADRLERAGYVRRHRDPQDRRRVLLEVTELTANRSFAATRPLVEAIAAVTSELDDDVSKAVADYLAKAATAMRAFAGIPEPPKDPV